VTSDYERRTTATTLADLPQPVRTAVAEHAEQRDLAIDPEAPAFLTNSRRLHKPGLLARMTGTGDQDAEHLTALVIGARDVIVCTHGEQRGTAVFSTRLEQASVSTLPLAPDGDGMSVCGFPVSEEVGSFYVGLGEPDGDAARNTLRAAIKAAKA
jgi:hypothetical protein